MANKTLLEKIQIVLDKYNGGKDNYVSLHIKEIISYHRYINLTENYIVTEYNNIFSIGELISICILENNPDLFD